LCLITTRWSWGCKTKNLFCRLLDKARRNQSNVPREFDIKSRVALVGKILLLYHSSLGVPTNLDTCLVSSRCIIVALTLCIFACFAIRVGFRLTFKRLNLSLLFFLLHSSVKTSLTKTCVCFIWMLD
jgi:hypothetical protein